MDSFLEEPSASTAPTEYGDHSEDEPPLSEKQPTTAHLGIPEINIREAPSAETLAVPQNHLHQTAPGPRSETEWSMADRVRQQQQQAEAAGYKRRELGVTWQNLTVEVVAAEAAVKENLITQFNVPQLVRDYLRKPPLKSILQDSHGCVKPGEMLLVLGRPGSGCTTLLKMLANRREGYRAVHGEVSFGAMNHQEAAAYRGQIVMNTEEELFYPRLTVGQTMDFATKLKLPAHRSQPAQDHVAETKQFLLEAMQIAHTQDTKVGNEFVRGVSGGERKRVSIIECMATNGSVFTWDNSTRGLDASTALEWAKALRSMTDILGLSTIVTLYQAGNGIYHLFDKVLVLDEGKQIYYGPAAAAKPWMEALGFVYSDGANIGDYLTGVTVPTERKIKPGFEHRFPRNADAILAEYRQSSLYQQMVQEYDYPSSELARQRTEEFQASVAWEKSRRLPKHSALTTGFGDQLLACTVRQYQILWGEKSTFLIKQVLSIIMALIAGSCFYNAPQTTAGLFTKGGAVFFSLLYNCIVAMSEVTESFKGRPVLVKHKSFALYHPAAYCLAQITADLPVLLVQCGLFSVILYWMVGLKATAAAFFTFCAILFTTTLCVTALFRCIGAGFSTFEAASKISGTAAKGIVMYAGYMIPKPHIKNWFVELYYTNPFAYAFQAALSNEFHDQTLPCVGNNLVPHGPGYEDVDPANKACTGVGGAQRGADYVTGDQYLASLHYKHSQLWRNYGILWAWWGFFAVLTIVCTCFWSAGAGSGSSLLIPREKLKAARRAPRRDDAEEGGQPGAPGAREKGPNEALDAVHGDEGPLNRNTSIFTWRNLTYTVPTPTGERVLLDNIHGWVKPGMLGALMGSSGAGKTTLLDVLAQRKTEGTIKGSIMVDGRELPVSFQRMAGYCEQLDVHEPYATVREALEFSALLRQSRDTPRAEKLRYVETIIDLLELHDLADTLIGTVGNGLSVEQRKRVTIGVELVSKPSILIFLDEPTSGLDGQSAYNTVRFLRKLADVGQAVLVTIHQPSAQLFAQFDTLLLLARGGKTVYFGDIGDNGATIKRYFGQHGAPCPVEANPAEFMIDVVTGGIAAVKETDWHQVWLASPEHTQMMQELDRLIAEAAAKPPGTQDDGYEFSMPLWEQIKIVTQRMNLALFRNTNYVNNKFSLHIISALLNGFSFWHIGPSVSALNLKLFTIFNFVFVAPGVINQLQPLFIQRRDIYDAREKKSKMYSWVAFVTGLIVSEFPYLCICAVLYFVCWYYQTRLPTESERTGAIFFIMLIYEFIYTGIGQFVAAYAPNPTFAALANPLIVSTLVLMCGVFVPYSELTVFWRYWMYYLNPFNYVTSGMLVFGIWGAKVTCNAEEFAVFDPVNGTCGEYLQSYIDNKGWRVNLVNPDATADCRVCEYTDGSDFLTTLNLHHYYDGWRNAGICVIFALAGYALVFGLMKLRTKASKKAE
ncbi:pleiotropic drug resistance protein, ABC superfamily [Aspergillus saccharolyticus JOP 1030-1]|uniref:Pleiotropic drug resistance protein, ABC superfamily n=1 Tax=Aspergillus saccharolyticus JOP 1030-1 TaxID=1450539 RepID=A0A319A0T1_9EURO|nr:pleiotropic drug resistance protein, ABC superfamily [Aspergillus saccharolyticus JOP 1030-1]PYH45898.1 pleiotropic drug resistance protein, ABC superfamily [Aspergillus saccharolyticus JOP 1030-1]